MLEGVARLSLNLPITGAHLSGYSCQLYNSYINLISDSSNFWKNSRGALTALSLQESQRESSNFLRHISVVSLFFLYALLIGFSKASNESFTIKFIDHRHVLPRLLDHFSWFVRLFIAVRKIGTAFRVSWWSTIYYPIQTSLCHPDGPSSSVFRLKKFRMEGLA